MFFNTYSIFIYIVLVIGIYGLVRFFTQNIYVRNISLLIINVLILLTLVKEHTLLILGVLSLLVFGSGYLLQKRKWRSLLASSIVFVILLFCIRNYPFMHVLIEKAQFSETAYPLLSLQKVGLSYVLFRHIHWLVESYKGNIQKPNLLSFLNYIFFFPTYIAGPIDRYNNFHHWLGRGNEKYQRQLFFAGVFRVFMGAVKTLLIVPLVIYYATDYLTLLPYFPPVIAVSLSLLAYSAYIYFDFSGYSDIAIGTGYMMGIRIPENFNNPYLSNNLSEFWKRWHMTFSYFLRIYVFKPSIRLFNAIFGSKYRLLVTILAYLFTFTLCGLWHGETLNFVYWGLWHGIGLSLYKLWTSNIKPALHLKETSMHSLLGTLITFAYVTVGWMFFHYKTEKLTEIFNLLT